MAADQEPWFRELSSLASWSSWVPFAAAVDHAPRTPGVYAAREGQHGPVVYVGMAGERRGQGLRGRIRVYRSGKALTSGLGEAVFDRALADPEWLHERLRDVERGTAKRAKEWGRLAFERADLHLAWATTPDRAGAIALERQCLDILSDSSLWNRLR